MVTKSLLFGHKIGYKKIDYVRHYLDILVEMQRQNSGDVSLVRLNYHYRTSG